MIRVLIVDDHPVVRAGLQALLATEPDIDVVGALERATDAADRARELAVDVVLMDLQFPEGVQGVEATRSIRSTADAPPVLILTTYDSDVDIVGAIEAGASGYLLKDAPPEVLLGAIRAAAAGESGLVDPARGSVPLLERAQVAPLSRREIDVLALVAAGMSNSAIGRELFLSEATVKSHLARIFGKLGASSRTDAVARGRDLGILRA